jgi:hypothetical protein
MERVCSAVVRGERVQAELGDDRGAPHVLRCVAADGCVPRPLDRVTPQEEERGDQHDGRRHERWEKPFHARSLNSAAIARSGTYRHRGRYVAA